ncbi:MAG: hypothetical protein H0X28_15470 [Solirubrobacterales bacterium]|nr:hypothetical protein [Solirubrobacterales bacterium]
MADETDGINEAFAGGLQVALTVAGRLAENHAREREQQQRDAQAGSEQAARELQARLDAERSAARAAFAPVGRDEWWERAGAEEIGRAWEAANTWKDLDPDAARALDAMRDHLRERYGVDVDALRADPAAVRDALETHRQAAAGQRDSASSEGLQAAALLAESDHADRTQDPTPAGEIGEQSAGVYDSAERRRELAASLEGLADEETVEARVLADTHEAQPAQEAVTAGTGTSPTARRSQDGAAISRARAGGRSR